MSGTPVIDIDRLTKSYRERRGVVDLAFAIEQGEIFGYLGPNGAGKTTTIRTVLDLIRPTSGRVLTFGRDARERSVEIHRRVGHLPGEFGLYDRMTPLEYLTYIGSLRGGFARAAVDDLAERFALDLSVRIASLSHGNRQKVGLIQAFMHRPELLILDEPTQGLDPLMQQEFTELLEEARREGRTVFLSSHVMPEVERVCDRVAIVREGRLVAVEDVAGLTARESRTVEVRFARPVDAATFSSVPGVSEVAAEGELLRLRVAGSMDPFLRALGPFEVLDLVSREPTLEDVFLTFYEDES